MKARKMTKGRNTMRGTLRAGSALVLAVALGGCMGSNELAGTTFGGIAGGAIGNQFGKGDGKVAATALGAVIGASVGGALGRSLDEQSRAMAEQATLQAGGIRFVGYLCLGESRQFRRPGRGAGKRHPSGKQLGRAALPRICQHGQDCRRERGGLWNRLPGSRRQLANRPIELGHPRADPALTAMGSAPGRLPRCS